MEKICTICGLNKGIEDFKKHRNQCIECRKKYFIRHNQKHKKYKAEWQRKRSRENYQKLWNFLKNHPCVDCGEADPVVLEFDHVGKKDKNIAALAHVGTAWSRIEAELTQCEVRCANCHRRKTAKQLNWKSYII